MASSEFNADAVLAVTRSVDGIGAEVVRLRAVNMLKVVKALENGWILSDASVAACCVSITFGIDAHIVNTYIELTREPKDPYVWNTMWESTARGTKATRERDMIAMGFAVVCGMYKTITNENAAYVRKRLRAAAAEVNKTTYWTDTDMARIMNIATLTEASNKIRESGADRDIVRIILERNYTASLIRAVVGQVKMVLRGHGMTGYIQQWTPSFPPASPAPFYTQLY